MHAVATLIGIVLIALILFDAFETVILPRGLTRAVRLTSKFYTVTWRIWRAVALKSKRESTREAILAYFGPLVLLMLLALWGLMLILGFSMLQWGLGGVQRHFMTDLYMSGTTFFTLGLGDITPSTPLGRTLTVIEAGVGFGFLAIVIGYLPVLYQAFSGREVAISLLDARAGSPPTATQVLIRHGAGDSGKDLVDLLRDWEHWAAELLESHLSFPVLCYYRSQHDRQSWVSALTAVLDTCALVLTGVDGIAKGQAKRTFAIARHAAVDLAAIFEIPPLTHCRDRLSAETIAELNRQLGAEGIQLASSDEALAKLRKLREFYEPYVCGLAEHMAFYLPPFVLTEPTRDAWQTSAWHVGDHL